MLDATPMPESIRAILRLSGADKSIQKLQRDFQTWAGLTLLALLAATLVLFTAVRIDLPDKTETRILRFMLVLIGAINLLLAFFLYKEAVRRYRYVIEIKKLSSASRSLKDTIFSIFGH
ncbi:MAG: hypothetical protein ACFFGZ_12745 [Candidatus Thorarchaeota archaeon]